MDSKTAEKPGKEELMETNTSVEKAKLRASSNEEEIADLKVPPSPALPLIAVAA